MGKGHARNEDTHLGAVDQDISLNTHKITNLGDPGDNQDAATKAYVDSKIVSTQVFFIAAPDANYGDYRVQTILGTGSQRFTIAVPCNFISLVSARLIFSPVATITGGKTVDLHSDYAKIGENYQIHSEDSLGIAISGTQDTICSLDLSSVLSSIAANDVVGILMALNTIGTSIKVFGIQLEFS